jgi:hypothetical protein
MAGFLGGSNCPTFEDDPDFSNNAGMAIGASLFELAVLDREGVLQKKWGTVFGGASFDNPITRAELDGLVRSLAM